MMVSKRYKLGVWLVVLLALVCTAGSFYAQYQLHMKPCPLCIFQRVSVMAVGLVALLIAIIPNKKMLGRIVGGVLISIPAITGLSIAIRHRYIQGLPADEIPTCGPGLNYMVETMPFSSMVEKVLTGSGECATVEGVMGLPLPIWSILFFSAVLIIIWVSIIRSR